MLSNISVNFNCFCNYISFKFFKRKKNDNNNEAIDKENVNIRRINKSILRRNKHNDKKKM